MKRLVFLTIFLLALVWLVVIPIWHTPDEQSHFAQVAFLAEKGQNPGGGILDTTEEIYISEQLLGTARDKVGNNKFTFHPDFNIEYTNSLIGKHEASISALSNTNAKNNLVHVEASYYPKLYYVPASWIYKLFYSSDLFTRVFVVRGWSLFLFLTNIFFVYQIGKLIFPNKKMEKLILTVLVGFQPMLIFANIGVTSDALGNLLFTCFLYVSLRIIVNGMKLKEFLLLSFVSWLTLNVKVQFFVILPVLFVLLVFLIFRDIKKRSKWIILLVLSIMLTIGITHPYEFSRLSSIAVAADSLKEFNLGSFTKYTFEYTLPHTIKEVMPWYWGVYKWLGVTYPSIVYRIINRIVFISSIGFAIWIIQSILQRRWKDRRVQGIIFMLFTFIVYFAAISVFDWLSWYRTGFQLAVQGRYFFPFISIHMAVLILGWSTILPNKWNIKKYSLKLLGGLVVVFNIYALYFVASSYYNTSSLQQFIIQASQYKQWIMKGIFLEVLLLVTSSSLVIFLVKFILYKEKESKNNHEI